jgi:uncharacterized protein YndB with AHSA1/START domain
MTVEELGTIERHGERYTLRLSRVIAAPIVRVWRAITEPDEIARWLGATVAHDARVQGRMRVNWEGSYLAGGQILAFDPPHVVEFEWDTLPERDSDSVVRFELREVSGGTELTLTHRDMPPFDAPLNGAGWHAHLDALKAMLSGGELDWRARSEALQSSYHAVVSSVRGGGVA